MKRNERVVKEIKPDGTVVPMTRAEEKRSRKGVKTVIRDRTGEPRLPWGHKTRYCRFCGKKGPRVPYVGGYVHRRCIPK